MSNDAPPPERKALAPATPERKALAPATNADAAEPGERDANGFDPHEFEWRPVPRRPRADGWTPDVQRAFIEALARMSVERACMEVGMSVGSAYRLRNAPGGESFARAWNATRAAAAERLLDIALQHALEGEEVPVYDQDGIRTGVRFRYNTRMAMFLLRAYHPERFRYANRDTRAPDEPPAPPHVPVAQAIASLGPVTPADPHLLTRPEYREQMIATARAEAAVPLPNEREIWRPQRVPPTHPRVLDRAQTRRARRERRDAREAARHTPDDERD